ncbi:MAG: hypothetical protein CMI16_09080 [Opitutaceae bacterium]|nr:hypothetical protein [Opitutaceae bacterium]|tara:strand:+ start:4605 stop:6527 length:1923 start_codon:yes stop_codon:yes gene_type:complete
MNYIKLIGSLGSAFVAVTAISLTQAQPSYEGPPPSREVIQDAGERRAAYLNRVNEVYDWRFSRIDDDSRPARLGFAVITMLLERNQRVEECNQRVIEMMETPGTGPFWMFPSAIVALAGQDKLSAEARGSIREAWRNERQLRGDTENHWVMYHASLYLMSELYPNEPGQTWYTGNSSSANLEEARGWLIDWMDLTTTIGQGEYNATHYIGEYAIPMLMLATYAKDLEMKQRGHMMLDWLFAELANVSLEGVLRGPNSRTDDSSALQRWNSLSSFFSWILFGNTPPTAGYGGWGNYFAALAPNYTVPEVIYRIATDRRDDILQHDRARTRRMWRYSDEHMPAIYKIQYLRYDYAVGSHQGRVSDAIQSHVWDVTWREDDPRGKHSTMYSLHPHSSGRVMQMQFSAYPEPMPISVSAEGKPSYNEPDKLVGCSPYEKVYQNLDTVIALYDIKPGERFKQVNGFFSKDLVDITEDKSGWIFARGGDTYLAYFALADYHWIPHLVYRRLPSDAGYKWARDPSGSKVLVSPHVKNGTIVQAASVSEFASFESFQQAMIALPLEFSLEPTPTVKMTTLRGKEISFTYDEAPIVDGETVNYSTWKLFGGRHLNAEVGGRKLTITHGPLQRVLDFNTLTISDTVTSGK